MITPEISPGFRQRFDEARNGGGGAFSFGNAVEFDGVNDFISIDQSPADALTDITVSYWIKTKTNFADSGGDAMAFYGTDSALHYIYHDKFSGGNSLYINFGNDTNYQWPTPVAINTWYHFMVTRDGTGVRAWRNGVEANEGSQNCGAGTISWSQCGKFSNESITLDGWMDEIAWWGVVGTEANAIALYNGGAGQLASDVIASPLRYYRLDESSGTNVPDIGTKGSDATLTNFADPDSAWVPH